MAGFNASDAGWISDQNPKACPEAANIVHIYTSGAGAANTAASRRLLNVDAADLPGLVRAL